MLKDLCTRCKHLLKLAKWQRLAEFEQLQEQLCDELWLNWTQRNFAAAWRLARRLAFKSLGAKCRSLRQVSQRPLAESFVQKLKAPGPAGGMEATECSYSELLTDLNLCFFGKSTRSMQICTKSIVFRRTTTQCVTYFPNVAHTYFSAKYPHSEQLRPRPIPSPGKFLPILINLYQF